ncbi:MAG: hypothetical protein H6624_01355 [Bdellovibrionaceae bacterium]|nr:hypothetical protein [Pseudobdellovibrionaceae bacterium]
MSKEDCVSLAEAIESLPLESQEVLWLRFDGDLSYQQTAEVVGKNADQCGLSFVYGHQKVEGCGEKGDKS